MRRESACRVCCMFWGGLPSGLVFSFHGSHRIVDGLADVRTFRQLQQLREPGRFRQVQDALRVIVGLANASASSAPAGELGFSLCKLVVGVAKEDQAENRDGI